jgi:class 3 adenylate cyclase
VRFFGKEVVIGDTVNVTPRVEGQTRIFDTPLIVTDVTAQQCENITFKELGSVQLKGRIQATTLLTVPGLDNRQPKYVLQKEQADKTN